MLLFISCSSLYLARARARIRVTVNNERPRKGKISPTVYVTLAKASVGMRCRLAAALAACLVALSECQSVSVFVCDSLSPRTPGWIIPRAAPAATRQPRASPSPCRAGAGPAAGVTRRRGGGIPLGGRSARPVSELLSVGGAALSRSLTGPLQRLRADHVQ